MPDSAARDAHWMRVALGLAARGLGRVWPNPAVGCVLVRDGRVIARGWTGDGGRPHAETVALARAGDQARGAVAYITLEPCAHQGQTPPCDRALIRAGIARAVIAMQDPDPRVAGAGMARLRDAGIAVDCGLLSREAARLNHGYLCHRRLGRPAVTLKIAGTIDGRIALANGESQWITGPAARAWGHRLRAGHDAVMTGIGTALADDPALTCRLPGYAGDSPLRILIDSRLRLPRNAVLATGPAPTWILTREDRDGESGNGGYGGYGSYGPDVTLLPCPTNPANGADSADDTDSANGAGGLDLAAAMTILAKRGITRLLVEGGGRLAASLIKAGLVDDVVLFGGGRMIGGDGIPALGPLGLSRLDSAPSFRLLHLYRAENDLIAHYARDDAETTPDGA